MFKKTSIVLLFPLLLMACSKNPLKGEASAPQDREDARKYNFGSIVGDDTLVVGGKKKSESRNSLGSAVNIYVWRACLDTVHFMPLVSADANGGVIVTDWYIDPKKPNERIKVTLYVRDIVLRADAIQAVVHKQTLHNGQWTNVSHVDSSVAIELENIILTKARNLKIQAERNA
jgi:hypothetical protein